MSAVGHAVHVDDTIPSGLTIQEIAARPVVAPLSRPLRTAVGEIPAAPLVLIDLKTRQGIVGRSYLFAYTEIALGALALLVEEIGRELQGREVSPVARMRDFDRRFRLIGWQGLVGIAVCGLDMEDWDAHARVRDKVLATVLGWGTDPLY